MADVALSSLYEKEGGEICESEFEETTLQAWLAEANSRTDVENAQRHYVYLQAALSRKRERAKEYMSVDADGAMSMRHTDRQSDALDDDVRRHRRRYDALKRQAEIA